jgi:8-oxo-dGTP pyrophosphatase MutT (NUDIX family)
MTRQTYNAPEDGPQKAVGAVAVRPKHAATLIMVRRDAEKPRVLMGRRAQGHSFMPQMWVFPGGKVDRVDYTTPAATDLQPHVKAALDRTTPAGRADSLSRALAMAAVRETFEEVGLKLARPAPSRKLAGPWAEFGADGTLPDLDALDLIARAITPPYRPKRFDARFFTAEADRLLSLEPTDGSGELDEIAWVNLDEALQLDLPNVTRFVLGELALRLEDQTRRPVSLRYSRGGRLLEQL